MVRLSAKIHGGSLTIVPSGVEVLVRRPFLGPGLALVFGILAGRFFPLPDFWPVFSILSLLPFLWMTRGQKVFLPLFLFCVLGLGILRIHEVTRLPAYPVSSFAREKWMRIEGEVVTLPDLKEKGKRRIYSFVLETTKLRMDWKTLEAKGKVQIFVINPAAVPTYRSRVSLWGNLSLPKKSQNPGEFDYSKFLKDQGIHAIFKGYGPRSLQILDQRISFFELPFILTGRIREMFAHRIDRFFSPPVNALLKALILGMRKDLPENLRDDFIKTGTTHLIAISGMNITLVAGSLYFFALCLGLPQKGAALVGLFSTVGYVFISGMGIPVVRAGWMAGIFFAGLLLEREKNLTNSLFFALFSILLCDPRALFQTGCQLSFLCVLSLILLTGPHEHSVKHRNPWLQGEWFQTVIVLIGTFPLCIVYFSVFSWMSIFTNMLAIPLFNLGNLGGLMSLFLAGLPLIGDFFVKITSLLLNFGLGWIRFAAEKPWGYFHLRPPSWWLVLIYYLALGFIILSQRWKILKRRPFQISSLGLWFVVFLTFFLPADPSKFSLTVLSVGANELLEVRFEGHHWLVNAGRQAPTNQARWIVSPFLRHEGINDLQGVLMTDFSKRHTGGLLTILDNFKVKMIALPGDLKSGTGFIQDLKKSRFKKVPKIFLDSGDRLSLGPATFQVIGRVNDQIFLLIQYQNQKFLVLPTWKSETLELVLPKLKRLGPVNVLILPASGRPNLSQWESLLSYLIPDWVVTPSKIQNLRPLLAFLGKEEIPVLRTHETGALCFEVKKEALEVRPFVPLRLN